ITHAKPKRNSRSRTSISTDTPSPWLRQSNPVADSYFGTDGRLWALRLGRLATLQGLLSAKKFAALPVTKEALIGKEGRFAVQTQN
ncbi:hypothetical protein, partial [Paracoccus sediminilitoris]|uniref:hypothetical protein n=1 Tax=Paracoccus sediminilitoris TaxID=2202419 RepID=UPI001F27A987